MEVITIWQLEVAEVNPDPCIGCGLCVTACTSGALSVQPKPEEGAANPSEARPCHDADGPAKGQIPNSS